VRADATAKAEGATENPLEKKNTHGTGHEQKQRLYRLFFDGEEEALAARGQSELALGLVRC